jgi:hypothetical protein
VYKLHRPAGPNDRSGPSVREAFTGLFELIQKHVFSCVLGQLAFACPEPPDPCCVLIGSVEVENGRLTRVINYPRWYLWCFANFFEVLIYTLTYEAACGKGEPRQTPDATEEIRKPREAGCCPEFEVDVAEFLELFENKDRNQEFMALSGPRAFRAFYKSVADHLNYMKPGGLRPGVLDGLDEQSAYALAQKFRVNFSPQDEAGFERRDPYSGLLANFISRDGDTIAASRKTKDGKTVMTGATIVPSAPARPISSKAGTVSQETQAMDARIKQLEADILALKESLKPPPQGGQSEHH